MDDVVARCRNQLAAFRIKELKDVLTRLGLPKQGKKQVLMDKVMGVLSPTEWQQQPGGQKGMKERSLSKNSVTKEEAAQVIEDIYRKLRGTAAIELASAPKSISAPSGSAARSDEPDHPEETGTWEVRCPCGSSLDSGTMIQCDNRKCGIWQHVNCVVHFNSSEGADPEIPKQFYCEVCRINFCDPFCVTLSQPLAPTKLSISGAKTEGSGPLQTVERSFTLSKSDRDTLHKHGHDLQVWCLRFNDSVPFRMHWPLYADVRINGVAVRVVNRVSTQPLGPNGRDDGPGITNCTREGANRIAVSAYDAGPFCVGVRIIRRRTVEQVLSLLPSVSDGEPFEDALARVKRCVNGGAGADAADDDDSDIEVVAESITVNLRCPMSGLRMTTAGRFKECVHIGCFDLRTFVELNQRARKWQCPVCMKNYSVDSLIIDPFFNRIASTMKSYGEDVTEVEMKADGLWRPKLEGEAKNREPWRTSDGTLVLANGVHHKIPQTPLPLQRVKVEEERTPLKIGIKRTHDGHWAVNTSHESHSNSATDSTDNKKKKKSNNNNNNSGGYDDERSVNQGPKEIDFSGDSQMPAVKAANWKRSNSLSLALPPQLQHHHLTSATAAAVEEGSGDDVIVLSDSDEESDSPGVAAAPYNSNNNININTSSDININNINHSNIVNNVGKGLMQRSSSVVGAGFLSNTNAAAPQDTYDDVAPIGNGWSQVATGHDIPYRFLDGAAVGSGEYMEEDDDDVVVDDGGDVDESGDDDGVGMHGHDDDDGDGGDDGDDDDDGHDEDTTTESSLRMFLPPQPARASSLHMTAPPVVAPRHHPRHVYGEELSDSWFSLSIGGSDTSAAAAASSAAAAAASPMFQGRERLDSLATASVLLGLNNNNNNQRHQQHHHHHRQQHHQQQQQQQQHRNLGNSSRSINLLPYQHQHHQHQHQHQHQAEQRRSRSSYFGVHSPDSD